MLMCLHSVVCVEIFVLMCLCQVFVLMLMCLFRARCLPTTVTWSNCGTRAKCDFTRDSVYDSSNRT